MKNEYEIKDEGFIINNDLEIENEKKEIFSFDVFIILAGVLSIFMILTTSYNIECRQDYIIFFIVFFSIVLSLIINSAKRKKYIIIISICYCITSILLWKKIFQGAENVAFYIFDAIRNVSNMSNLDINFKSIKSIDAVNIFLYIFSFCIVY